MVIPWTASTTATVSLNSCEWMSTPIGRKYMPSCTNAMGLAPTVSNACFMPSMARHSNSPNKMCNGLRPGHRVHTSTNKSSRTAKTLVAFTISCCKASRCGSQSGRVSMSTVCRPVGLRAESNKRFAVAMSVSKYSVMNSRHSFK